MDIKSLDKHLQNVPSWNDPELENARTYFVQSMRGRQYGYGPTLDAWAWFLEGWCSNDGRVPDSAGGDQ